MNRCKDCKYAGDLEEICPKYGPLTDDGFPLRRDEFPLLCKDCPSRDIDFCKEYGDLFCHDEQDPFGCKADLAKDGFYSLELLNKEIKALKDARLKRGLPP